MMYEMIGNPETEKELLEAASPLFHIDKIKAPLLVAQGANDPRVKQAESDQIVDALKAKGIDVYTYLKRMRGMVFIMKKISSIFIKKWKNFLISI